MVFYASIFFLSCVLAAIIKKTSSFLASIIIVLSYMEAIPLFSLLNYLYELMFINRALT